MSSSLVHRLDLILEPCEEKPSKVTVGCRHDPRLRYNNPANPGNISAGLFPLSERIAPDRPLLQGCLYDIVAPV